MSKILTALVAWRTSVSILNQLLYQAFQFGKLVVLDQNNIITSGKSLSNLSGESISIVSQPRGQEPLSDTGDVILVKLQSNNYEIDGLYHIEKINVSFSRDFRISQEFGLRMIDNNLNYYPGLTRNG